MAARKRSFAGKAKAADTAAVPASVEPPADAGRGPHVFSEGKTQRMRAARLCPGGNSIDHHGAQGDGCGRCPSVAECTVARFNPKA